MTHAETKKNTDFLEGVGCPNCHSNGPFRIAARIFVTVHDDGIEDEGSDYEWDNNAFCQCCECDHSGKLKDFLLADEAETAAGD